ncbi:right-handed parallel beta-helix repeat-containing protein [Dermabacter hominis]|uniref:right-handed parallel beta-helix repeat-containing protein n=1 Tax=Dermabacter hominis TaxID=36740 RepID=UPI001F28F2EC
MSGPKWAKGWIIENNLIHDAKCSAVSLGKDATTGDNYHQKRWDKPGYQYQLESVYEAYILGWSKERIGSHVVRNNEIYNCGQNGIVGHLGCVFSRIENNHIHHIATRREYFGHEIGGIKLHAPIDTVIAKNRIHDCTLGIWLDWEIEGTRISRNVLYRNNRDIFLEVSHGPYVVDFNVFGSKAAVENVAQGGAYIHNLLLGTLRQEHVRDRATPYHLPHSTAPKGYAVIEGGDDRYRGNIFAGNSVESAYNFERILPDLEKSIVGLGTDGFEDFPATMDEYIEARKAYGNADHMAFLGALQPVELRDNVYSGNAQHLAREDGALSLTGVRFSIVEEEDGVYLEAHLPQTFAEEAYTSALHESYSPTRFSYADFEDVDGSPVSFEVDITGHNVGATPSRGPVAALSGGDSRVKVWG